MAQGKSIDSLLKVSDLVRLYGVSRKTIERWRLDGRWPGAFKSEVSQHRIGGGEWRFPEREVMTDLKRFRRGVAA